MAVKVLGISGSPHRHGNTETLLDSFLAGAKDAGATVEKVIITDLSFTTCRGCNACHKTGACVLKDEAPQLFEKISFADCVAVASPIYSMGITAELKSLIDRAQYLWARKFMVKDLTYTADHFRRHKALFISTAGLPDSNVFDFVFPTIRAFFNGIGFEYFGNILANNMDGVGGVKNHPSVMQEAYNTGRNVVKILEGESNATETPGQKK